MTEQDRKQLKLEISHIFDSGANHLRVFETVERFIDSRNLIKNHGDIHHVKGRLTEFINDQEDIDPEIAKVIDENFWDLL